MPEELSKNKQRLAEITAGIEQGVMDLFQSDRYKEYLRVMARFHNYSLNNTLLIYMQKPDATLVAGYSKWDTAFGRHVKRGEKGIQILAPTPFKKKVEEEKLDPITKAPMLDADGKVIMKEKEVTIPMYRVVSVFDVSQTEGKPIPQLASELKGDVRYYGVFMEALKRSSPVPISFKALAPDMDGFFSQKEQSITLRDGMSQTQTVCAAVHEITHATLHNREKNRLAAEKAGEEPPQPKGEMTMEIEAESVAYAVCQYYGIDTSENSFGYLASWSQGKDMTMLRDSLETITKASSDIIRDVDRNFMEICKERGIDLSPDVVYVINNEMYLHIQGREDGFNYALYDVDSLSPILNGQIDMGFIERAQSDDPMAVVRSAVYKKLGLVDDVIIETAIPGTLELIQAAQQIPEQPSVEQTAPEQPPAPSTEQPSAGEAPLPEVPAQNLDEYPMPSKELSEADLEKCGYMDGDLIPITKEQAEKYMADGFPVYGVVDGGASMCFETVEITAAPEGVVFAITTEDWENSADFRAQVTDRLNHQPEREAAFLNHDGDCFAIYQLKDDEALRDIHFMEMDYVQSQGMSVERGNYNLIFTGELPAQVSQGEALDGLWEEYNTLKPADYHAPSMSVSDIVAIKQNGEVSCHYCDRIGFKELPGFLPENNPLKNAEMSMEDDYGMIDGIINNGPKEPTVADLEAQVKAGKQISLMDLAAATHRERQGKQERPSVLDKLREATPTPKQTQNKTAPKRSAEMEI